MIDLKLDTLRELRLKLGWNCREAGEKFGVSERTFQRWESSPKKTRMDIYNVMYNAYIKKQSKK